MARVSPAKRLAAIALTAFVGAAAAGCSSGGSNTSSTAAADSGSSSAPQTSITIAQYQGIQSWITQVAVEGGFFAKHGIQAKTVTLQNGPAATAALATGDVQLIVADTPLTGPLMTKGTKLAILTGAHKVVFSLMGASHKSFPHASQGFPAVMHDLKGKSVGVYGLGTTAQFEVQALLQAAGMSKDDVKFQVTPGIPASLAALQAGRVDAAIVSPPAQYLAQKNGSTMLVDLREKQPGLTGSLARIAGQLDDSVWTSQQWLNGHKDAAKRIQDALVETDTWMHDPANLDKVLQYVSDFGVPQGSPTEQKAFLQDALKVITTQVNRDALNAWMDFVVSYGLIPKSIPMSDYLVIPVPGISNVNGQ